MSQRILNIVSVTGGLWAPSKTTTLTKAISTIVAERLDGQVTLVELGPLAHEVGSTLTRDAAPRALSDALLAVEKADVLIAVTPVFRGTFGGHFKHFFDLVALDDLRGVPVIVGAAGGGEKHCLVLEYALRPLFGFFQAFTVPTGIYASERDFDGAQLNNPLITSRIHIAASEVATLLARRTSLHREDAPNGWLPRPLQQ
jgi:FMN reductase